MQCNFVSKIIMNGRRKEAIKPPNTLKEVSKAYKLFPSKPTQYKMNKEDEKQNCNF